ncbi:MAG: hypothetical protein M3410_13570 [Acidobacteriota bacterium]|nr:hypothetical protein [Acidobacteriota bacterium]
MATNDKEVRLIPRGQEGSAPRAQEAPHLTSANVRSTVESRFRLMEQTHDRIRAEKLTRLAHTPN